MSKSNKKTTSTTNWPDVCNTLVKEMGKYGPFGLVVLAVLAAFVLVQEKVQDRAQVYVADAFLLLVLLVTIFFYIRQPLVKRRKAAQRVTAVADAGEIIRQTHRGRVSGTKAVTSNNSVDNSSTITK